MGATMDITMSIASAMTELAENTEKMTIKELVKSGLNVGKDAMGTMSNTLILAYVGESLNLILLVMLNNSNLSTIINSDFIASEILRSLCGTIGMIAAIPITTYIYGIMYALNAKEVEK
ncbi:YibE/F-like protein [compost metagenome]